MLIALNDAEWALLISVIIPGGIYGGFISPTEASNDAVVYVLIVGTFIDTISALVSLTPILLPVVVGIRVNPIHFGGILVANLAIRFVTPSLGGN